MTEIDGDCVTVLCQLALGKDRYQGHTEKTHTTTIVLREAAANHLDNPERNQKWCQYGQIPYKIRLVPGAGAIELELGIWDEGLAQRAVKPYATALEVIPERSLRMHWEVLRVTRFLVGCVPSTNKRAAKLMPYILPL
ncbi:uncharacterized protein HD556DRAFT_1479406 [Suillus plorans]|uniref:Uncharacterized protein n=1 Tax=Suillus plorans TaxID=116603 RepID=A0A9P7DHP7_9AGAM|nr:uncharacterized protein HD556DRAFT_1479406 [Suillus plorans]KAG1793302.1 hypothetical protein HD556DRAFT_1479406 [Suillus plorans]